MMLPAELAPLPPSLASPIAPGRGLFKSRPSSFRSTSAFAVKGPTCMCTGRNANAQAQKKQAPPYCLHTLRYALLSNGRKLGIPSNSPYKTTAIPMTIINARVSSEWTRSSKQYGQWKHGTMTDAEFPRHPQGNESLTRREWRRPYRPGQISRTQVGKQQPTARRPNPSALGRKKRLKFQGKQTQSRRNGHFTMIDIGCFSASAPISSTRPPSLGVRTSVSVGYYFLVPHSPSCRMVALVGA